MLLLWVRWTIRASRPVEGLPLLVLTVIRWTLQLSVQQARVGRQTTKHLTLSRVTPLLAWVLSVCKLVRSCPQPALHPIELGHVW